MSSPDTIQNIPGVAATLLQVEEAYSGAEKLLYGKATQ
jgi:hypothetical protein